MSSKRHVRTKLQRSCQRHKGYPSMQSALSARYFLCRNTGEHGINVFRCSFCGHYHVGHMPHEVKRSINHRLEERGG
jgi:hypothetical protein